MISRLPKKQTKAKNSTSRKEDEKKEKPLHVASWFSPRIISIVSLIPIQQKY
jgi:hypothetical protein